MAVQTRARSAIEDVGGEVGRSIEQVGDHVGRTLEATVTQPLADLYRRRERQRQDPAFGKLLGKNRVYLRLPDPEEPEAWWLTEHDLAGRRLRQIELRPDGTAAAGSVADWPMNPPFDLGDPLFASNEISQDEFEQAWERAARDKK